MVCLESHLLVISQRCQILQDKPLLHGWAQRRQAVVRADHHGAHLRPGGAAGRLVAGIVSLHLLLSPAGGGGGEVEFLFRLPPVLLHCPSLPSSSSSLPVLRLPEGRVGARLVNEVWKQPGRAGSAAATIFQGRAELRQRFGGGL